LGGGRTRKGKNRKKVLNAEIQGKRKSFRGGRDGTCQGEKSEGERIE